MHCIVNFIYTSVCNYAFVGLIFMERKHSSSAREKGGYWSLRIFFWLYKRHSSCFKPNTVTYAIVLDNLTLPPMVSCLLIVHMCFSGFDNCVNRIKHLSIICPTFVNHLRVSILFNHNTLHDPRTLMWCNSFIVNLLILTERK